MTSDEVNFNIPLAPIEDCALACGGRVRELRPDSRLNQMAPVFAVGFGLLQAIARLRRHQRRVEDLKLGSGSPLANSFTGPARAKSGKLR